jgi:hypothetical protein
MLKIPTLPWKNSTGTYYPEDELDRLDRWRFKVKNESSSECFAPIMFVDERPPAITGFTPSLCDTDGVPVGIPIQISKNWHRRRTRASCHMKARGSMAAQLYVFRRVRSASLFFKLIMPAMVVFPQHLMPNSVS